EFGTTRASPAKSRSSVKFIPDSNQRYRRPVLSKGFADAAGASPARAAPGRPAAATVAHETSQSTRTHLIRPPLLECESIPHPSPPLDSPGQEEGPHTGPTPRASPSLLPPLPPPPATTIGPAR